MIVNLTPHEIVLYRGDERVAYPPCGIVCRVGEEREQIGTLDGAPVTRVRYTAINDLPGYDPETTYIVSAVVLAAAKALSYPHKLVAPDTGAGAVRDAGGRIIGTRGWTA